MKPLFESTFSLSVTPPSLITGVIWKSSSVTSIQPYCVLRLFQDRATVYFVLQMDGIIKHLISMKSFSWVKYLFQIRWCNPPLSQIYRKLHGHQTTVTALTHHLSWLGLPLLSGRSFPVTKKKSWKSLTRRIHYNVCSLFDAQLKSPSNRSSA